MRRKATAAAAALCACAVLALALAAGCSLGNTEEESYERTTYLRYTQVDVLQDEVLLFTSVSDLDGYTEEYKCRYASQAYVEQIQSYTDDFFAENYLLLLNITENSGSNGIVVRSLDIADGVVTVNVERRVPGNGLDSTTDICEWGVFVEMDADTSVTSAVISLTTKEITG